MAELNRAQEHFRDFKITVYHGLSCNDIMFEGQVDASECINQLYDVVERYVITDVTGAMAKSTSVSRVIKFVGVI